MRLKPDHELVIWIVFFLFGFFLRGIINDNQIPLKEIFSGLVTLIAVYAGASYAYRLQNERAERNIVKDQVAAANHAIYTLFDIWHIQKQYQEEIIKPYRNDPLNWLHISPTPSGFHDPAIFDTKSLSFLLSSEKPEIYSSLLQEEKQFKIMLAMDNERSKTIFQDLHPKMESLGIAKNETLPNNIEDLLGPALTAKLQTLTKHLITNVDKNTTSIPGLYKELRLHFIEMLPAKKIIKVAFIKPDKARPSNPTP